MVLNSKHPQKPRPIWDREKRGRGYGGGRKIDSIHVATRMTLALRWAARRAILMFHLLWRTKSQDSVHRPHLLKRKESRNGFKLRFLRLPA